MLKKNKLNVRKLLLIILLVIVLSSCINIVNAKTIDVPDTVNVYKDNTEVTVRVYNSGINTKLYSIILHTKPFVSEITPSTFRLKPKEEINLNLIIEPLNNQLISEYRSTLELSVDGQKQLIPFTIIQNKNKVCGINIDSAIYYNKDIKRYLIELNLKNKETYPQNINFLEMNYANGFKQKEITLDPNKEKKIRYSIDTNVNNLKLNYICNTEQGFLTIDVPKKIINKKSIISKISGFFTIIDLKSIYNSLIFQIILLIILICLVLSFATRYLKLINENKR